MFYLLFEYTPENVKHVGIPIQLGTSSSTETKSNNTKITVFAWTDPRHRLIKRKHIN